MIKNGFKALFIAGITASMVQASDILDVMHFRSAFMDACSSYIATVNRLQTTDKVPALPGVSDDLIVTALRKVAVQFQDLRLRHDFLASFTFKGSDFVHTAENIALQKLFTDMSTKLNDIADSIESIEVHGWEIAMIHSQRKLVEELKNDLATIAALDGQFASMLNEAIATIIDPYLAACERIASEIKA